MLLLDFRWWGLLLQTVAAVVIAGFAAAAFVSVLVRRDREQARLQVSEGVIGGLNVMTAATLLRTIDLRTWKQILMFSLILALRISLKKLFVWEKARALADLGSALQPSYHSLKAGHHRGRGCA